MKLLLPSIHLSRGTSVAGSGSVWAVCTALHLLYTGNLGAAWVHIGPASLIDRARGVLCCVCDLRLSLRRLTLCPVAAPHLALDLRLARFVCELAAPRVDVNAAPHTHRARHAYG